METKNERKTNKINKFLKETFFLKIPKEDKKYVKDELMKADHNSFKFILIAIVIFQLIMIIYKLSTSISSLKSHDKYYLICYAGLAIGSLVCYFVSEHYAKKNNSKAYFVVVAIAVNLFYIWALGITLIDCLKSTDLTTFAYVVLTVAALIILEPWVFTVNTISYIIILILAIYFNPEVNLYASTVISSISIAVLTMIVAFVNFSRRIKSTILQREVSELNSILISHVYYDELTNLYNRRYLTEHINEELNTKESPSGVIMIDLDDFKSVNDQYGHVNGDICLNAIGELVNDFISTIPNSFAVRYGGAEFLIFIKEANKFLVKNESERIRTMVSSKKIKLTDNSEVSLTISVGSSCAKPGMDLSKLISKADDNLYVAKNTGKDIVYFE